VLVTLQLRQKTGKQRMGLWFISRHRADGFSTAGLSIGHENRQSMKYLQIFKPCSSRIKGYKFFSLEIYLLVLMFPSVSVCIYSITYKLM
jgi:hypothetical protein